MRRVLRIAKWLGAASPIAISQVGGQADGKMMVVRADQSNDTEKNEVNGILSKVRKAATRWGVANVEEIVANIAESFGDDSYFNAQQIINVVKSQPDFSWLDEESGWFWFAETPRNGLVSQIDKALSVAPSLRVADLRAAVSRHHRRRGFAPPQRVLLELCRQCGFEVNEGIVHAKSDLDSLDVLSETEWLMVEVLKDHGPLMKRVDFEKHCQDLKIPRGTFYNYLNHSPALHKYARGVYGLPGVDVAPGEVEALAPDSRDGRRQVLRDYGWLESGEAWTGYSVSSHMLKQGTCGVPAAMQSFIQGHFALRSADGTSFGSLACRDYYGNGLSSFFRRRGAEEGDFLIIVFDLQNQKAILHLGDENLLESYQSLVETEDESETDEIGSEASSD